LLNPLLLIADLFQFHRISGDSGPYLFFDVDPKLRRIRLWKPSIDQIMVLSSSQRNDQVMYQIRIFFKNGDKESFIVSADVLEQIKRSGIATSKGPRFNAENGPRAT
jgi:hypothetical protein